jgi:hypothetical protein
MPNIGNCRSTHLQPDNLYLKRTPLRRPHCRWKRQALRAPLPVQAQLWALAYRSRRSLPFHACTRRPNIRAKSKEHAASTYESSMPQIAATIPGPAPDTADAD